MMITYQTEPKLSVDEFRQILLSSTLGERRPVEEPDRLREMIYNANLIVTARDGEKLIGLARSLTDLVYCTYLSDLAVDKEYQKKGIGKELIRKTKLFAPKAKLILLSAPKAVDFYEKINMSRHPHSFYLEAVEDLP